MLSISNLIIYIPTILFCFILLWEVLSGCRRGLRKSVILFINMALALLISIIIFSIVFGGEFDTKIVKILSTTMGWFGQSPKDLFQTPDNYDKLSEYMNYLVINNIEDLPISGDDLKSILSMAIALAQSLVKMVGLIVVFIMYWLFKFIFYIIYLIGFKEGRKKKKRNAAYERGEATSRYKRKAGFGALVGLARGVVLGVFIFSFIGSLFFILTDGKYEKEDKTFITDDQYHINEIANMVNRYGTVGIGSILEWAKNPDDVPFYLLIADYMTSGQYETQGETPQKGSLYLREELGPIVSIVKEAYIIAVDYGVDVNRISDSNYLLEFMNTEKDGITYADRVDSLITKYSFGPYTLLLSQSLVNAMANSMELDPDSQELSDQLLYCVIAGENSIKAEELITNENINALLKFALCVVKNKDALDEFGQRFSTSTEESLAFGVKRSASDPAATKKGVTDTIYALDSLLGSLTAIKNELITDVMLIVIKSSLPEFSLEGVNSKDAQYSAYKIKWKEGVHDLLGIVSETVDFIIDKDIKNTDALIDEIINSLSDDNSPGSKLVINLAKSDISGILLNAEGFTTLIDDMLKENNISVVSMPKDFTYGNYYNEKGELVTGEICNLILTIRPNIKPIYDVIKNSKNDDELLSGLLNKENGIFDVVSSMLDTEANEYSLLMHNIFSQALINFDELGMEFRVVIDKELIDENGYIDSKQLVTGIDTLSDFLPYFTAEEIDYKSLITSENIKKISSCKLLYATGSILIYDQLKNIDMIKNYIPTSYALGTDEEIDANLSKWTDADNGELITLVNAVVDCNLIDAIFKEESESINYADLIFGEAEGFASTLEKAINDSVLLNCILTGVITETDMGDFQIKIPQAAQIEKVDNLKRINGNQISSLINVCKDLGLDEVIKQATSGENSEVNPDELISKILNASDTSIENLFKNYVLNATITSYLQSMLNADAEIELLVPNDSFDSTVDNNEHLIIKTTEYTAFIGVAKKVFKKTEVEGNVSYSSEIDFNNILKKETVEVILDSQMFSATLAYFVSDNLAESLKNFIKIPSNYTNSKEELITNYSQTGWSGELENLLNAICDLNFEFSEDNQITISPSDLMVKILSNDVIGNILKSDIIHLSISSIISDVKEITIPDVVKESVGNENWVKSDELTRLFDTIEEVIGKEAFEDIQSYDEIGSKINVDSVVDKVSGMELADIKQKAFASIILQATVAQTLLDKSSEEGNKSIIIPKAIADGGVYSFIQIDKDGNEKTEDAELFKILTALDALDLISALKGDINTDSVIDKVATMELADIKQKVFASIILQATVAQTLLDKSGEEENKSIKIPAALSEGGIYSFIQIDKDGNEKTEDAELFKILTALDALDMISTLKGDIDTNSVLDKVSGLNDKYGEQTKLDAVEGSKVIWYTLSSYVISDAASKVKVPNAAITMDGTEKNLKKTEVSALITAMNKLNIDINSAEGIDVNTILSESEVEATEIAKLINDSYIIRYTLTDLISTMGDVIKFANAAKETDSGDQYLTKSEVTGLVGAIKTLGITDFSKLDIESLLTNDKLADAVVPSYILKLTLTDKLSGIDEIVLPSTVLVTTKEDKYVSDNEIKGLITGIQGLGMSDFSSVNANSLLSAEGVDDLVNGSDILRATVYDKLKDLTVIKIPKLAMDKEALASDVSMLTKAEMTGLVGVVNALDLTDFNNFDASTILNDSLSAETINNSYIVRYTISNHVISGDSSKVKVPAAAISTEDNDKYISKTEVAALMNAVNTLNIDVNSPNGIDINTILSNKDADATQIANLINASYIIRYTLTDLISTMGDVIKYAYAAREIVSEEEYVTQNEVTGLVGAIKTLEIADFSKLDIESLLTNDKLAGALVPSYILKLTLTEKLKGISEIKVPSIAYVKVNNVGLAQDEVYVSDDEIKGLIAGIQGLGMSDFRSVNENSLLSANNVDSLVNGSYILRTTIYDKLKDLTVINIPKHAMDTTALASNDNMLTKEEMTGLVGAVNSLNLTKFSEFNANVILNGSLSADAINKSDIVRFTITNKMCETGSTFEMPKNALELLSDEKFITSDEIKNFIASISGLNINNFDEFDVNTLLKTKDISSKISNSLILRYTFTNSIMDVTILAKPESAFEVKKASIDNTNETFISTQEVEALINALNAINLDLTNVTVDYAKVASEIATVIESDIMHTTISDAIFTAESKLDEPNLDNPTRVLSAPLVGSNSTHVVISKDEIKAYFNVANELGYTGYDTVIDLDSYNPADAAVAIKAMIKSQIIICTYSQDIIDWFQSKHLTCSTIEISNLYTKSDGTKLDKSTIVDKASVEALLAQLSQIPQIPTLG